MFALESEHWVQPFRSPRSHLTWAAPACSPCSHLATQSRPRAGLILLGSWVTYPILYAVSPEGTCVASETESTITFIVADLVSKNCTVFNFLPSRSAKSFVQRSLTRMCRKRHCSRAAPSHANHTSPLDGNGRGCGERSRDTAARSTCCLPCCETCSVLAAL